MYQKKYGFVRCADWNLGNWINSENEGNRL